MIRRQSNTSLYVVLACVGTIAAVAITVRAMAPEERWGPEARELFSLGSIDENSPSKRPGEEPKPGVRFDMNLDNEDDALDDNGNGMARRPSGRPLGGDDGPQIRPILWRGKNAVEVRYATPVMNDELLHSVAVMFMEATKDDADRVGVQAVVIVAVGPVPPGGKPADAETHTVVFEKGVDGQWSQLGAPGSGGDSAAGSAEPPVAEKPGKGGSSVIIEH